MNELRKYEIAAQIQEEAERRTEKQEIKENIDQPKPVATSPTINRVDDRLINKSIRQMIGQALIEDVMPQAYSPYVQPEDKTPKKIKDSIDIIRVMSNLLYQIQDSYSSYNTTDEEIKKILLDNNTKAIDICMKKLNDTWKTETKEEPKEEKKEEEPKEEKEEPPREEIANAMNQIMSFIAKNEEVVSPTGDIFIIEESNDSMSRLRNKITTKKYNIETKILKSWIEENKNGR